MKIVLDNYVIVKPNGPSARMYFWKGTGNLFSVKGNFYAFPYGFDYYVDLDGVSVDWVDKAKGVMLIDQITVWVTNGFDGFTIRAQTADSRFKGSIAFSYERFSMLSPHIQRSTIQESIMSLVNSLNKDAAEVN